MPKLSAGIVAYRRNSDNKSEIFLVHPGGPLWKNKDAGTWSIPKGEYTAGEDALEAAKREFKEETGNILNAQAFIPLKPVKLKSGKVITAWAVQADFEGFLCSNNFEMEWPPRSGKKQSFPEVDNGEWFEPEEAKRKINEGQLDLITQLEKVLL